jgi:replicative DNA helicase
MRELMEVSKTLNINIIAMAQLSRAVEGRGGNKRPALSDLRDSGSLEQAAHYVFAPYRPEYYKILEDENGHSTKGAAEIITLKNRNGPLEDYPCRFDPVTGFYEDSHNLPTYQPVQFSRNEEAIPF